MYNDRLKNYLKYILVVTVLVFSVFYLNKKPRNNTLLQSSKPISKDSVLKKQPLVFVERHTSIKTQKVRHKLDSLLVRIHKRNDFHGSILVAQKGKILYQNQIGTADFGQKKLLNKESAYQLASVSKQFTAAAILLLKEKNLLKLTDTVVRYFPNFPFKNITINQLLHHTSGLPNYFWIAENEWDKGYPPTNLEMMNFLETSTVYKFFRPGRNFDYSNTGYFVLASIIEKVSGKRYADYLKSEIFNPLQMNNSFVYSFTKDTIRSNQLAGYRLYRGWRHLKINGTVNDAIVGDKNVYTTNEDLFKWIQGLNSGKLISHESLDLMYTKGKTKYGRNVPYGFGFRIDTKNNEKVVYHYGKWNGFSTGITQYPEKNNLVIIILEHTSYGAIGSLNRKIKRIVLNNFIH